MKRKLKSNKGISLIEILVSLAIVGIMIIPVSSIVNTGIKTNKKSQVRQQAALLGQEILEDIEVLESVSLNNLRLNSIGLIPEKSDDYNNNQRLEYEIENYITNNTEEYTINILLEKNEIQEVYDYQYPTEDYETYYKLDLGLESVGYNSFNMSIGADNSILNISPEIIYEEGEKGIKILVDVNKDNIIINEKTIYKSLVNDNNLIINLGKNYKIKNDAGLNIEVLNRLGQELNIYIQKSYECEESVYIQNQSGIINIFNNIRDKSEYESNKIQNLYNITVEIKNKKDILFKGQANKNLDIK